MTSRNAGPQHTSYVVFLVGVRYFGGRIGYRALSSYGPLSAVRPSEGQEKTVVECPLPQERLTLRRLQGAHVTSTSRPRGYDAHRH